MKKLSIGDTLKGSRKQHDFYKDKWKPLNPENSKIKALWLFGELGEVIDVIKKNGANAVVEDKHIRKEFVKEVVDCYMYLADILNCFGISEEEAAETYFEKLDFNLKKGRKYWNKNK